MTGMTILEKEKELQAFFSVGDKYEKIINLGRKLPPFPAAAKIEENLVAGCQSLLYLECTVRDGLIYFNADSDALISKGLAALLICIYSEEAPDALLTHLPHFLRGLGLRLSPGRSNGLASLYAQMRSHATEWLSNKGATHGI